jgi:hypothetical protein
MTERDTDDVTRRISPDETPTEAVYTVVARVEGVSPADLPPLAEFVDPGALNTLLEPDSDTHAVGFSYAGYHLTVTPTRVSLEQTD